MKRIIVLLLICAFVYNLQLISQATTDSEIRALRAVKHANARLLNRQIKEQKNNLDMVLMDTSLTQEEKTIKIEEIQQELSNLYAQREQNAIEYRETKKDIKGSK